MTPSQKLRIEASEKRQRLNDLLALETMDAEQRAELDALTKRMQEIEIETRAAIILEAAEVETHQLNEPDAENRERLELRSRAQLSNFFSAAARGHLPSGPEAELQAAAKVNGGIPLELWDAPRREVRQNGQALETRAVTGAPGTVGVNLDPIYPQIFAYSIAPRLGIEMPEVDSGTYATAVIAGSVGGAAYDKGADAVATAATFSTASAAPKRVSARLELTLEDIAAVGQANFESALRENASLALSDALDLQVIAGDGQAPNLTGILQRLTDPSAPGNTVASFDDFIASFSSGVDGLWANMANQVGIVCNPETYRLALQTFRDATGQDLGDMSFADYAMAHFGGFWTNKRMPDSASNIAQGILYRMGRSMMGGSMGMRTAVCPHWGEVTIDDIYSGAASATRSYTLHVLLGDVILIQPDAYSEVAFRVST